MTIVGEGIERPPTVDTDAAQPAPSGTILVEFGALTPEQQAFIDLHLLRAVGTSTPTPITTDGTVVEFWVRAGETPDSVYDDVRGWAIGNRLPIRRRID